MVYNFSIRELSSGEEETYTYREDGLLISSVNNEVRYDYDYNEDGLLTTKNRSQVGDEYDVAPCMPTTTGKYGLENHHGVMNEWAKQNVPGYTAFVNVSPTVALSVDNHKLTKEIFREWSRENYGRPVGD
ncbi:hypothetical protein WMW72_20475 [Paenibacillus filicis]|uniref:Tox-SHH domain-containing protein n=1 Tax=Paenibacillus filicis TaxID=669464 RepID=A0ABU9DN40_9BACL